MCTEISLFTWPNLYEYLSGIFLRVEKRRKEKTRKNICYLHCIEHKGADEKQI